MLFTFQRFGTDKVGYTFAPIICVWFSLNAAIGLYNFVKYDPSVVKAINPKYIIDYFKRNKKDAWISLGGVVLSITGTSISSKHYATSKFTDKRMKKDILRNQTFQISSQLASKHSDFESACLDISTDD